jgi:hypothetical protein
MWPLGTGVAFVELPLADAMSAYEEWAAGWAGEPTLKITPQPEGTLTRYFEALLPLEMPYTRRLLVGTTGGWTAVFDNSRLGGDPFPATYLGKLRDVRAVAVKHRPRGQGFPVTQFELFGPTGEPPLIGLDPVALTLWD